MTDIALLMMCFLVSYVVIAYFAHNRIRRYDLPETFLREEHLRIDASTLRSMVLFIPALGLAAFNIAPYVGVCIMIASIVAQALLLAAVIQRCKSKAEIGKSSSS